MRKCEEKYQKKQESDIKLKEKSFHGRNKENKGKYLGKVRKII